MLAAAISGYKFLDENCDGIRNTDLIQGSSPDVVFVVDVSSSTAVGAGAIFVGQSIGDVNSDGVSNTILDAELAGFIALNRQLIAQGLGDTADVGIVLFGGNAVRLDVGTASGDQITIKPNADLNANGVKDIEELLSRILHGGQGISSGINGANTNYEAALQEVIGFFNGLGTATGNGNMVFLTDGRPNSPSTSTTVYADEVDVLEAAKVNLNAFGAGGTSEVPPLQVIDPDAVRFDSTDELLAAFNGLQGSKTSFKEPGLAGVKIWLDIDRDGILDADEPFAISAVDNPGTAVDETGNYRFDNLPNGIYDVREVVPPGMIQTAPAGGFTTVNVSTNGNYNVYFGNRPGEIAGIKWSDLNGNGVRDRLLVGDEPDVVFVIDVSGSTTDSFVGSQPVGDVNGDGSSNTILDAEIAGFIALNQSMINAGFGVVGTVSIIAFETSAISLDLDPKAPGVQISTTPSADLDGNGVRDIEQALRQLRPLGSTNYEAALSQALTVFGILGTPPDQSNLIFLSDGAPNSPGAHSDEVGALRAAGHQNLRAFGAGTGASLLELQVIDTGAQIFNSPDELVALFGGVQGAGSASGGSTEPGLAGVKIYIDMDNDGVFDPGEPSTVTAADNPLTPEDETGMYSFSGLAYGTYIIREVAPAGQYPTYPVHGLHEVTIGFGSLGCVLDVDFGNALPGSIAGTKWYDADGDGVFDADETTLSDVFVYVDDDENGQWDSGEPGTLTDRQGRYRIDGLAPGYHVVREMPDAHCPWVQTYPYTPGYHKAFVSSNQTTTGLNFGNYLDYFAWVENDSLHICSIDTDDLIGVYFDPLYISVQVNNLFDQFSVAGINSVFVDAAGGSDKITVQGLFAGFTSIDGGWGNDNLTGGPGDETIIGGDGSDILAGSGGDDSYIFDSAGDVGELDVLIEFPEPTPSNDTLSFLGSPVGVTVDLKSPSEIVRQGNRKVAGVADLFPDIEMVVGSDLDDVIRGNDQVNKILGGDGNDRIIGRGGNDQLFGGAGDDTYEFATATTAEADTVTEVANAGTDTLLFSTLTTDVTVNLGTTAVQTVHANRTLNLNATAVIENIVGGTGNDTLTGNSLANTLTGGPGNDNLIGAAGDDTYLFSPASAAEADRVTENANEGADTLNFAALTTSVVANLILTTIQPVHANRTLTLNSAVVFENLIGGSAADTLLGNGLNNRLSGSAGDDKLFGAGGNDLLLGGANNDTYMFVPATVAEADEVTENLSEGIDTLSFAYLTTSVVANLGLTSIQSVHLNRTLKLNSASVFEEIVGGSGNDTLTGNSLANTLTGNAGNDMLTGGSGDDTYVFGTATTAEADAVTEAANAGTDRLSFSTLTTDVILGLETSLVQTVHANRTLKLNAASVFEEIVGGSGNDTLSGNSLANTLTGNSGNDKLAGGSGDDTYVFGTVTTAEADTVTEATSAGTDTLSFSSLTTDVMLGLETSLVQAVHANRTLKLNAASVFEEIVGGSGNDTLSGNSLANTLTGNAGNDKLTGNGGDDSLVGGLGDDTYVFGTATTAEADTVTESSSAGTDTLSFSTLTTDVMLGLETSLVQTVHANRTLKLNAASVFESIVGGSGHDTLSGNSLANTLTGNAGNDKLTGNGGDDSLVGGSGDDTYVFATATTAEADTLTEAVSAGADTLSFSLLTTNVVLSVETSLVQTVHSNRTVKLNAASVFENIVGGSGNDTLTGNSLANILAGNAGGDTLNGGGGRDILIGGLGLDTLNGGDDEDIVIAGRTTSDSLFSDLNRLLVEWASVNSYATRISNLRAGVGSPAVSLKAKVNVLNDAGEDDSLVGGNGTDWYFRALDDVVTGLVTGEVLDVL